MGADGRSGEKGGGGMPANKTMAPAWGLLTWFMIEVMSRGESRSSTWRLSSMEDPRLEGEVMIVRLFQRNRWYGER